jgi:magnesium-transporting ATPase (P-type)
MATFDTTAADTRNAPGDWHTVVARSLGESLGTGDSGLSRDEARRRLERDGPNQLPQAPPTSALVVLLHQFQSPLIYILVVAALVTMALAEYIDAGVIAAVLLLNASIGFVQERQAENSVRALMQLMAPGDLVLLESGARVPADLRLLSATALRVDESLLTGESLPVTKTTEALASPTLPIADRTNVAFMGSVVTSGRGRGYVVAIGTATAVGGIAESIRAEADPETPLQARMARFGQMVGIVVAAAAVLAFAIGLWLGESPGQMFTVAVALAVAAVPEGLPVVFTITLALGVRRMARRHAVVRRLPAVETLGSTTVIGSDKTGTLTENRMTVREVWADGKSWTLDPPDSLPPDGVAAGGGPTPLARTLMAGVLTNEAELYRQDSGLETHGDPTEAALLVSAARAGYEPEALRAEYEQVEELPFEPERQYSASVRVRQGEHVLFVKGAPEKVLAMATHSATDDGAGPLHREAVLQKAAEMASRGGPLSGR